LLVLLVGGCAGTVPYDEFSSQAARVGATTDLAAFEIARDRIAEEMGVEPEDVLFASLRGSFDAVSARAASVTAPSEWDTWTVSHGTLTSPYPVDSGTVQGRFTLDDVPALAILPELVAQSRARADLGEIAMITAVDVDCPAISAPEGTPGNTMSSFDSRGGAVPGTCDPIITITVDEERRESVQVQFTSDGSIL
jgi:hypothetical protein